MCATLGVCAKETASVCWEPGAELVKLDVPVKQFVKQTVICSTSPD